MVEQVIECQQEALQHMAETFHFYPTCEDIRELGEKSQAMCLIKVVQNEARTNGVKMTMKDLDYLRKLSEPDLWDILVKEIPGLKERAALAAAMNEITQQ